MTLRSSSSNNNRYFLLLHSDNLSKRSCERLAFFRDNFRQDISYKWKKREDLYLKKLLALPHEKLIMKKNYQEKNKQNNLNQNTAQRVLFSN